MHNPSSSSDVLHASARADAQVVRAPASVLDRLEAKGRFEVWCHDIEGRLRWYEEFPNLVVTVGKNLILDSALSAAGYTATEYLGLISSVGYSAISASDTMTSHPGWTEAGTTNAPTFSGNRGNAAWSAASGGVKAFSANPSFSMTGAGTVKGAFLVGGAGATNGVMNTAGTLISAGLFVSGDRAVLSGDTVSVSYSMSI